jgi:hypothetical protein
VDLPVLRLTVLKSDKKVGSTYRTAVDSNLTSGTLVAFLRNLFAEATYLLGEFSVKSALFLVNRKEATYENNLASTLEFLLQQGLDFR